MNIIDKIEKQQMEKVLAERSIPDFDAGDTLQVNVKVVEGILLFSIRGWYQKNNIFSQKTRMYF